MYVLLQLLGFVIDKISKACTICLEEYMRYEQLPEVMYTIQVILKENIYLFLSTFIVVWLSFCWEQKYIDSKYLRYRL